MRSHSLDILVELTNTQISNLRRRLAKLVESDVPYLTMNRGELIVEILKREFGITEFMGLDEEELEDDDDPT